MRHYRGGVAVLLVMIAAACATVPVNVSPVQLAPRATIDSTGSQIRVEMTAPPDRAASLLVSALVEAGLPVTSNQGGIIEAKLPKQTGMFAQHEVTVRGYVTPRDSGSAILLFAEEASQFEANRPPIVSRINSDNTGRSGATWKTLQQVAAKLGAMP